MLYKHTVFYPGIDTRHHERMAHICQAPATLPIFGHETAIWSSKSTLIWNRLRNRLKHIHLAVFSWILVHIAISSTFFLPGLYRCCYFCSFSWNKPWNLGISVAFVEIPWTYCSFWKACFRNHRKYYCFCSVCSEIIANYVTSAYLFFLISILVFLLNVSEIITNNMISAVLFKKSL